MKSNLHRRAHCSGWGQANLRGIYPTFKARYKHDSNHRIRIADCMLALDELAPVSEPVMPEFDTQNYWSPEQQADLEAKRYRAWVEGTDYPDEYKEYDQEYLDYSNCNSVWDYNDPIHNWDRVADIVTSAGGYNLTQWNTGIYHVEQGYIFIGSIRQAEDLTWHVDYVPQRGEQTHYEFDYLDTSVEAAMQLLMMLHKLEIDDGASN